MLLEDPDPLLKSYCRYIVIRKGTPRPFCSFVVQVNILLEREASKLLYSYFIAIYQPHLLTTCVIIISCSHEPFLEFLSLQITSSCPAESKRDFIWCHEIRSLD